MRFCRGSRGRAQRRVATAGAAAEPAFGFEPDEAAIKLAFEGFEQKVWLDVPFEEKDEAKALGARWDGMRRLWYKPACFLMGGLARWESASRVTKRQRK